MVDADSVPAVPTAIGRLWQRVAGTGILALPALLTLHVATLVYMANVFIGQDDVHYASLANAVMRGSFRLEPHHHAHRFAVFVPTALVGKLLGGISVEMLMVWPILTSLLQLVFVYLLAAMLGGRAAALFAGLLFSANLLQWRFGTLLFPDAIVSCFMTGALLATCRGRGASSRHVAAWGCAAALSSAVAFLSRETAVWMAPFLVIILVVDFAGRRHRTFWTAFFVTAGVVLVVNLAVYAVLTGDPLGRLRAGVGEESPNSLAGFWRVADHTWRWLTGPLPILLSNDYTVPFVIALPLALGSLAGVMLRELRLVAGYFFSVLLGFWFAPTSLSTYVPLFADPRYLLPLHAPMVVMVAVALRRCWTEPSAARLRMPMMASGLLFVVLAIHNSSRATEVYFVVYACLAVLYLATALRLFSTVLLARSLVGGTLALAFAWPAYFAFRHGGYQPGWLAAEKRLIRQDVRAAALRAAPWRVVVVTDSVSRDVLPLYFGYRPPENLGWMSVEEYRSRGRSQLGRVLFYVHYDRIAQERSGDERRLTEEHAATALMEEDRKFLEKQAKSGSTIAVGDGIVLVE